MNWTTTFRLIAAVLAGLAAYMLYFENPDWAFAAFALAVCSFFFGMRFQLKTRLAERSAADAADEDE